MDDINQIPFNFDPRIGMIIGVMVGFLVFAVSDMVKAAESSQKTKGTYMTGTPFGI